jgi:hypothetical protein
MEDILKLEDPGLLIFLLIPNFSYISNLVYVRLNLNEGKQC